MTNRAQAFFAALVLVLPGCGGDDAGLEDGGVSFDASSPSMDANVPPSSDGGDPTAEDGGGPPPGTDGGTLDASPPPPASTTCRGYATRYWDCCKAHCGWPANASGLSPLASCSIDDVEQSGYDQPSSCTTDDPTAGYTCFSLAPRAVTPTLSYGFAAVPASAEVCGRCYRLDFDGTGHYDASDPGSNALAGKTMIVQATNIGHDVAGGQFDILIPGGGVGAFNACTRQWGLEDDSRLGAQYGGFLTACRAEGGSHDDVRACVRARCAEVFADARFAELRAGCEWFVDWYQAADNPNLDYSEVECPPDLIALSGLDRRPLDDIAMCEGGDGETCECDRSWASGGCGEDDGSCCWDVCCGH